MGTSPNPLGGHTLECLLKSIHQSSACNVPVSGESRGIQQNSLDHPFGSPASKMSRSEFHQVEPGATGPHTDFVTSSKDFPEPDPLI